MGRYIEGFLSLPSFRYRVNYIGYLNENIARSSGVARSSEGLVNVAWVELHRNRHIRARERRLIPHVLSGSVSRAGKSTKICMCPSRFLFHPV